MTASKDEQYIQEAKQQTNQQSKQQTKQQRGFSSGHQSTHTSQSSQPKSDQKPNSRLEQDRFFIEAASDRRGALLADATAAASYRKAMHLLKMGYTGELTQQAMQELADEWNSDDFSDIAMGETIDEGDLRTLALPSSTEKNYFALPSAKDKE